MITSIYTVRIEPFARNKTKTKENKKKNDQSKYAMRLFFVDSVSVPEDYGLVNIGRVLRHELQADCAKAKRQPGTTGRSALKKQDIP